MGLIAPPISAESGFAPGFVGRIPVRNLWLLMLYASDLFRTGGTAHVAVEESPDELPDLVAEILAHAVEARLHRQLSQGYRSREEWLSRQLALLFMVIFDAQANAGKALQRFTDWLIDREWLAEVYEQQKDLLDAEGLSPDGLIDLLGRASTLGFAVAEPAGWRLLPAVCRYLDHFEGLAATAREDENEPDAGTEDNADDVLSDEEID